MTRFSKEQKRFDLGLQKRQEKTEIEYAHKLWAVHMNRNRISKTREKGKRKREKNILSPTTYLNTQNTHLFY